MSHTLRSLLALLVSVVALIGVGCQSVSLPKARPVTRAMWVTRFDYQTPQDIERIAESCKLAGCNTILFQVRGNATAFYRSSYEPWAEQFNFADPGFDPLAVAIEAARKRDLRLHAWVNVMPGWWGGTPPSDPKQLYNKKPEWFWYDQQGERQPLASRFYVSVNPCLPEVREYLVDVIEDIVGRYPIDGVHLDYIRLPNDEIKGVTKPGADYPRDRETVALFRAETNTTPDATPQAWDDWRAEQITKLVRDTRRMIDRTKPYIELSAAVGPVPEKAKREHFQDVSTWIDMGLLDAVYPMNYSQDRSTFNERLAAWRPVAKDVPVVMGVEVENNVQLSANQLEASLRGFRGYAIFAYSSLFDSPNTTLDDQSEAAREARQTRRKAMMPYLQELSRSGAAAGRDY